ncbi:MAG: ECF transporter S component [Microthrixaceae bacterium]
MPDVAVVEPSSNGRHGSRVPVPLPAVTMVLVSVIGLAAFAWPFLVDPTPGLGHAADAPFVFAGLVALVLVVMLVETTRGGLDAKAVAMLAVLAAVGAALRPLGAGTAGIETGLFLLILAGRVFGAGFGFVLGTVTMFASALLTAGVGPWLPFQMLAAGWVGAGAGLLPPLRGRGEVFVLSLYGVLGSFAFGMLMNLWFWPFLVEADSGLGFRAGAPFTENLRRFVAFCVTTSFAWDTGRAVTTVALMLFAGERS